MGKQIKLWMTAVLAAAVLGGCSGGRQAASDAGVTVPTEAQITGALEEKDAGKEKKPDETDDAAEKWTESAETMTSGETVSEAGEGETAGVAEIPDEMSLDELIEKAREEGKVVVYSCTSGLEKVCSLFTEKYGIKVEFTQLGDSDMIEKVSSEAQAGVSGGADAIFCQDGARVMAELITPGYSVNYLSSRIKDVVPEEDWYPLVFQFCNKVFIFNDENADENTYTNVWQFTDPQYAGVLQMKNAVSEGVNMDFFTMIVRDDIAEKFAEAYKEYYGREIELTTPSAGYEWIKGIYGNGLVLGDSDTGISEAVGAKGQKGSPIGLFTLNKYVEDKENEALAIAENMQPIQGFYYPIYSQITGYSEHPYAARLFIEFLYTEEGWSPYASRLGDYSANRDLPPASGDKTLDEWAEVLVKEDPEWVYENRMDVENFIQFINRGQ